ncbi:hypothetical protein Aperf_G00000019550 [Anoplocephala perfoliata]
MHGLAYDATLDFCSLAIVFTNKDDCNVISTGFQAFALCSRIERKRKGHASDYIRKMPLSDLLKYRAIVCVSGDGVFHELVNGLWNRKDLTEFPTISCIPAGSGNAIASSICYRSGYLPDLRNDLPKKKGWISIDSAFVGINIINVSNLSGDGAYCGEKKLGSDYILIHLLTPDMTRSDLAWFIKKLGYGHSVECTQVGISLAVKAFRLSLDDETSQMPYLWSIDGENFGGVGNLQGEMHSQGYPLLTLPEVPRNPINHAPIFY